MEEFSASINEFLPSENMRLGRIKELVSKKLASAKAEKEYEAFNKTQKIISDFDKEVKRDFGEEGRNR